jgi:hypothetical protein
LPFTQQKNFPTWAEEICEKEPFRSALSAAGYHRQSEKKRNPRSLPTGQIVAVGLLEEVERITRSFPVAFPESAFGDYTPGRYAWRFSTIYRLTTPIAANGARGLWDWLPPASFWDEIQGQLEQENTEAR